MDAEKDIKEIIKAKSSGREYFDTLFLLERIQKEVNTRILELLKDSVEVQLELAPEKTGGNLAFSTFQLGKSLKKDSEDLATAISEKINEEPIHNIERAEAVGAYVNLVPARSLFSDLISLVRDYGDKYGQSDANQDKLAWIEYSSPQMAKPLGVGHLGTTLVGQALSNIYEATGYSVIRHNYIGDWGTPFGKLIYAYKKWHSGDTPSIQVLKDLYVRFNQEAKEDPEMEKEARMIAKQIEEGDLESLQLWEEFKELSLEYFRSIYSRLKVEFDLWLGESFFTDKMENVVEDAKAKKLVKKDDKSGALVVDLGDNIPTFLLQKGDGTSLYHTRDLAAIKFRIDTANPEVLLYVVGQTQTLYLRQLFILAQRMKYIKGDIAKHISTGTLLIDGEAMSTRKGTLVESEKLINQSVEKAKAIVKDKNKELTGAEIDDISEIVGVGAVIYSYLRQSSQRDILFDLERALDFEGGSAAYLQYTYVRINSIINKLNDQRSAISDKQRGYIYEKDIEISLAKKILFFPVTVLRAQRLDAPHLVATYLEELAQLFNSFYAQVQVVATEDPKLRESRKMLISSVATVIKNGLSLLNVSVPNKM